MSTSSIVLLIVAIVLVVIIAYLFGIIIRRKNDSRIAELEERKESLMSQPISEEIEAINQLHLVGQSQEGFQKLKDRWSVLTTETFKHLEEDLEVAEVLNDTFHFLKFNRSMEEISEQLDLTGEELQALRDGLTTLREQEEKNSAKVKYALDMYEDLQNGILAKEEAFGPALDEINRQLSNIQAEFSQFVALNTSGDPIEAAEILERAEEHTIALGQITETVPELVTLLLERLPDQLEDLQTGYGRLLEEGYYFSDSSIEGRFQIVRESITDAKQALSQLELDKVEAASDDIEERLDKLYQLFEAEIAAHQVVKKQRKLIPSYMEHSKANNSKLQGELDRLLIDYILDDADIAKVKTLKRDLEHLEETVLPTITDEDVVSQPYSSLEKTYQRTVETLKDIEDRQMLLLEDLKAVEQGERDARTLVDSYVNRLHIIKRFMENRRLPGIPQDFLSIFFTTSSQLEALMTELGRGRIDIKTVNQLSDALRSEMAYLEDAAYQVVQDATLTEQLLQYSNRYRSFEPAVQTSFEVAYQLFEANHDYKASFDEISYALEIVEPGVTDRFVKSYEKTRETIRF